MDFPMMMKQHPITIRWSEIRLVGRVDEGALFQVLEGVSMVLNIQRATNNFFEVAKST